MGVGWLLLNVRQKTTAGREREREGGGEGERIRIKKILKEKKERKKKQWRLKGRKGNKIGLKTQNA